MFNFSLLPVALQDFVSLWFTPPHSSRETTAWDAANSQPEVSTGCVDDGPVTMELEVAPVTFETEAPATPAWDAANILPEVSTGCVDGEPITMDLLDTPDCFEAEAPIITFDPFIPEVSDFAFGA